MSTHFSGNTYSDDDNFESFLNDVVPQLTHLHPHPTAVSILTHKEPRSVNTTNTKPMTIDNKDLDGIMVGEKATFSKNSAKLETPHTKFQPHGPKSSNPRPVKIRLVGRRM